MVGIKLYEIRSGREFILARWRNNIDRISHSWFLRGKIFVASQEHKVVVLVKSMPVRALGVVSSLHEYMHRRYGKQINMIKGRGVPTNKGSVSFFVSAISDYKKEIREESRNF